MHRTLSISFVGSALFVLATGCTSAVVQPPRAAAHADAPAVDTTASSSPGCVRIQRGVSGSVTDTRIAERWPDVNYGAQPVAFAGKSGERGARQVLLGFDLASIPAGAVVSRATLTVQKTGGIGADLSVHRVTKAWDEKTATWTTFGKGFEQAPMAGHQTGGETCHGPISVDVTELVRGWQTGAMANHGVLLSHDENAVSIATSEAEELAARPRLEICFTPNG